MLRNYMEDIVDLIIPNILDASENICKCPRCINDIKAITLNKLQPHYIVTEKGEVYTKVNELVTQFRTDIIKEVVMAMDIVSKKPNH